jgi:hypothetical protein
MPFDPTGLRPPKVTVLPPSLAPWKAAGNRHGARCTSRGVVHLPAPPRRTAAEFWWWLIAFALIARAADPQPTPAEWRCSPISGTSYCNGADQRGREW